MKFLFILSILFSIGASRTPDNPYDCLSPACKIHLQTANSLCTENKMARVRLSMNTFYDNCILCGYTVGTDPALERRAFGCWIKSENPQMSQQAAEALVPSFDFSTIYQENFSY